MCTGERNLFRMLNGMRGNGELNLRSNSHTCFLHLSRQYTQNRERIEKYAILEMIR